MSEVSPAQPQVPNVKGAIYLGISTLLFLAGACGWLTIYYEHTEHVLARSWWIRLPLVILALDLAYITVVRFRRSWSQAGMISTHAGLIIVLTGSFVTCLFSRNGMLEVGEGETATRYSEEIEQIAVKENPNALPLEKRVVFSASPDREDVSESIDVPGGTTVTVDKYYHHFRPNPRITNDSKEPNPCLHVVMGTQDDAQEAMLSEKNGPHGEVMIEGRTVLLFYTVAKSESEFRQMEAALPAKRYERLSIYRKGAAQPQSIDVATSIGKDIAIEGTPYQLRINKVYPTLSVSEDGKSMSSIDEHPWNPVLLASFTTPKGVEEKKIFPTELQPPHGAATWPDDLVVRYEYAPYFEFVRLPDGRHFVMGNLLDDMDHATEVHDGEMAALKWVGIAYKAAFYSNARMDKVGTPDNAASEDSQAVHVTVRNGAASNSAWIPLGREDAFTTLPVGNGEIQVGYQQKQKRYVLPFQLHLDRFVEDHYEGTATPSAWHSFVTVTDEQKGASFQYTIQMNEPLRYRGWKLFQSDKHQDDATGRWTSVLSVSWDPGDKLIYPGCVLVVAGILFMFYFKKPVQRWESRRLEARGAVPKASRVPVAQLAQDAQPVRG